MGQNQLKGGCTSEVRSTIKSLEDNSLQTTSVGSSPIFSGDGGKGNATVKQAPPFKNAKGKPGMGSVKRKEDMSSGRQI